MIVARLNVLAGRGEIAKTGKTRDARWLLPSAEELPLQGRRHRLPFHSKAKGNPMKTLLTATALILSMTATASAAEAPRGSDTIGSGPIYANNENWFYCSYTNLGLAPITVTGQEVYQDTGIPVSISTSCANGTIIGTGQACNIQPTKAFVAGGYSCMLTFSTAAAHVRGVMQIYDANFNSLAMTELR